MKLLLGWIFNALALLAVAYLLPNIHVASFLSALLASFIISLVNVLIRPLLILLTLPITVLTLGLFILVINGVLFYFVGQSLQGFRVDTFTAGILGAILYSVFSWVLTALLVDDK